ncbi:hypothetical protein HanIR_Chr01g0043321 [Helianthus annuus]|nr:hypothetical protein HanIR_Chr01g0043321 [Helianthus annuus]
MVSTNGCTTTGRPVIRTTTHFTDPHTFFIVLGPGSGIVRFELSPKVSAYGGSPTTIIAKSKLFDFR